MSSRMLFHRAAMALPIVAAGFFACSDDDPDNTMMPPPVTTGSLRGAVLDNLTSAPIAGANVTTRAPGSARGGVVTDAAGRFELDELAEGEIEVLIDAKSILPTGNPDIHYTDIALHETVVAGSTVDITHPVFLPRIDETEATAVDGVNPTIVEPPSIPGLAMDIAAGAATFPDGGSTGGISIVEIPIDRAPMSLPPGTAPGILISIQPAGTTFDPPAPLRFPNVEGLPADFELDILSMDPIDGEFILSSRGRVTPDGAYIETVPGTGNGGVAAASWHAAICDAHTVTGRIVDGLGDPVAGATVEVLSGINSSTGESMVIEGGTGVTDAGGNYSIPGVRVCNVRVRVTLATSDGAGESTFDEGLMAEEDGTTAVPDITLIIQSGLVSFDVAGIVTFADGTPAPGAFVEWYRFGADAGEILIDVADATGAYLLEGLVTVPGAEFELFATQQTAGAFGDAQGTAPDLADNGSTVPLDIVVCTEDDIEFNCPIADWSLAGNTFTISQAFDDGCVDFDLNADIELVSLNNGVLVLNIFDGGAFTLTFNRVQGSGPTGVSTANIPGIYRQVDPGPTEDTHRFIQVRSNGDFGIIEGNLSKGSSRFEAGTYALAGNQITVSPNYDSEGPPDAPFTNTFAVSGNTLTITDPEEGSESFTRCEFSDGTSIEGYWFKLGGGSDDTFLAISDGEFAAGNYDDLGGGSPARDFHESVKRRVAALRLQTWTR